MKFESHLRAGACWMTVAVTLWSLSYYFAYGTDEGSAFILEDLTVPLISEFDISWQNGARLVMLIAPVLILASVCTLVVTSAPLYSHLQIWTNRTIATCRGFAGIAGDGITKKNQFGLGEVNFDVLSFFLVTLPVSVFFVCTLNKVMALRDLVIEAKLKAIGNAFGMAGTLALSFFLIPVTRHSVLLVAIGWSPLQALRIHIWAGYTSFLAICLHGVIHFIVWLKKEDLSVWDQIIPDSVCWKWKPEENTPRDCRIQWYNLTGILAFFFFAILIITSVNWFRRRFYRLFYIFHMICGIGMLGAAVMHWRPIITFIAPSIVYYIGPTMPALIQALASRARGGVKVVRVVHLADAGGCKEIHVSTACSANRALDTVPSMFIKMCVPSISMVWHPFTVFKHPRDPSTVRILFRPVGPFTKAFALRWEQEKQTPTILDGFYHAGNRTLDGLHHDHVIIYCGGVAITPFLSLIPDLLSEIAKLKELGKPVTTKKLVFFWACREEGLASYISESYLKGMKQAANAISFDFDVIVYHTKRKPKAGPLDPSMEREESGGSNQLDTTFMSELTLDGEYTEVRRPSTGDETNSPPPFSPSSTKDRDREMPSKATVTIEDEHTNIASYEVSEYVYEEGAAHDMELHRFMPARHAHVWHNIPAFFLIGGSLWLFFYIIFYYYRGYDVHVHEFYDRLWPLLVCLMTSVALSLAFEAGALSTSTIMQRVFFGKPESERPNHCPAYLPIDEEIHNNDAFVEHRGGRPDVADIFRESRQAECPGIFMCGPPAMTDKVRQEANKENSIFGLTRYALYEDPFEM